ncbi:hypothetical protein ZEAMMB73_Zm00001d033032 [Zea mays]|uniref:Ubiquitin-like protease family profile domain-containing protein n=1 Tax=Zea mays TaxID=4577 RepID=A0A1D6KVU8_MAIZE|nr:hypothetical protein ZEAMMB73_Zm00001d033032 [Zea mays]
MIVGFCLARMEDQEKNTVLPTTQRDNKLSVDESLLVCLSHNKPKKSVATVIVPKDYICTDADLALIDWIKEIPCEPRVEVVLIDDACVERKWIECLFKPSAYIGDEVIDCYINLIKTTQQLKCRSGGRVHIENAFQFNFLKRDGDVKTKTDELYPIADMAQICSAERRVLLYLDHDMVFIPINIRGTHWYLAVINARNMEIQVLDSLGTTFDRNDLTDSIKGLQRQIDMVSQRKDLKDHRWPNLQVASWPLREIDMGYAKQTDSSSCGLFLLNYIEYWTGDELSDSFTQDDMSHFRKKLAAILLSSYMNKRRGYPIYKYDKEVHTGSPSDVEILDSPTNHKKRKLLHVLDNSEVLMEDEDGPITQADLQRWFVDEWDKRTPTKVSADGCTDDFLMSGLSTKDMPVTKADLIDVLCDYIMAIQDDRTLEMIWVRSFNPFKIEISVKDLQNILSINLDMTLKCFDMAVRLLASKESRRPKGEIIKNRKHYMDMRFWRMIGFGKLPKYHQDPTTEELTKTLDCWPSMNYYITACKYVLMPWKFNGCYALFVIDHGKKHVTFIDFAPIQDWCKHMPYKRFAEAIIIASKKCKIAYSKKRTGWTKDIFKWQHTIQPGVPIDLKEYFLRTIFLAISFFSMIFIVYNLVGKTLFYRLNTSYLILQAMAMWGNDSPMKFVRVSGVHSFHIQTYIPIK